MLACGIGNTALSAPGFTSPTLGLLTDFSLRHMAWDMWRNGKSINNPVAKEVKSGAYNAVFPIPQANINTSHGALKQNPGF